MVTMEYTKEQVGAGSKGKLPEWWIREKGGGDSHRIRTSLCHGPCNSKYSPKLPFHTLDARLTQWKEKSIE